MNSIPNILRRTEKSTVKVILLMLCLLSSHFVRAQEFQFVPDVKKKVFYAYPGTVYNYGDLIYSVEQDLWGNMVSNPTTYTSKYQFKSVTDVIKVGVNHDTALIVASYKYKVVLSVKGYSNPVNPASFESKTIDFVVEHNNDSLQPVKDQTAYKLKGSGYHKMEVAIASIWDISGPSPVQISNFSSVIKNFFIESSVITQRYDKQAYNLYVNSSYNSSLRSLNVSWGYYDPASSSPGCTGFVSTVSYKPVKYELEWTYVDDYELRDFSNTVNSYRYKNTSTTFTVPYNFKNNATRIQTYDLSFSIPMVYEHGTVVYRIRTVRPDPSNYGQLIYSAWNVAESGTLTPSSFGSSNPLFVIPLSCSSQCMCVITTPMENDKFDWQYSINFAEEGKYKHVLNYFDGAGHNRQTLTKINSDQQYIVGADHIYDYEGRPAIQTLPTPILSQSLGYKNNLSLKAGTLSPYKAADFDFGCGSETISGFDVTSLAGKYYSSANADKSGMQKFVPDAEGYPFIETIYSPDNTNKVIWQGGAGLNFQRFNNHGTFNAYVRADQSELNKLFGTQVGRYEYYPKVITRDPNQQLSYSIFNQSGKVIATALVGTSPDVTGNPTPIVPLSNIAAPVSSGTMDILANLNQSTSDGKRSANYAFFPEAGGNNTLLYHGSIFPYATNCTNQYINANGFYDIKVVDECGTVMYQDGVKVVGGSSITTSNAKKDFTGTMGTFQLNPAKYTLIKELYFPDTTILRLSNQFTDANSEIGLCYDYEDNFIRRSIDAAKYPCKTDSVETHCDLMRRKMKEELYPGAKYGGYLKNPNGTFAGGMPNSIFTTINEDGEPYNTGSTPAGTVCWYYKDCTNEGYGNIPGSGSGQIPNPNDPQLYHRRDSIVWIPGSTVPSMDPVPDGNGWMCMNSEVYCQTNNSKFRYQWNCTTLPNVTYTVPSNDPNMVLAYSGPANNVPPDILISLFNDAIAEKLLPYHPEYCKLLFCEDNMTEVLEKITDYKSAQALGLSTLAEILARDPLCVTNNANAPFSPSQLSHFSIFSSLPYSGASYNTTLKNRLDSLAVEKAYCGCDAIETYAYCRNSEYASQIKNMQMADTQVQNAYIRNLVAFYISNRNLLMQKKIDATNALCEPCGNKRMTLVAPEVFPVIYNGDNISSTLVSLGFPASMQTAYQQAISGTTPTAVTGMYSDDNISNTQSQAGRIVSAMLNCVFPNPQSQNDLLAYLSNPAIAGPNGSWITPDIVLQALNNFNIPVDELCNPYLAEYGIYDTKKQVSPSGFVNKDAAFYIGLKDFLARTEIKTAMYTVSASGGTSTTPVLSSANRFESELINALGTTSITARAYVKTVNDAASLPSIPNSATTRSYYALVLTNTANGSFRDTLYFTKRMGMAQPPDCSPSVDYNVNIALGTINEFSFKEIHSILDDASTVGVSNGYVAGKMVFAQLAGRAGPSGTMSCDNYAIWSHTIPMLKRTTGESMDGCINCVQIKNAVNNYFASAATYRLPIYADEPYFEDALTSFLNFKLGKKHTYGEYEKLMKGCALSDQIAFRKSRSIIEVDFFSQLGADNFITGLNNAAGDINIDNFQMHYLANDMIYVWLNFKSVPKNKLRLAYNYIYSYVAANPPPTAILNTTPAFEPDQFLFLLLKADSPLPNWNIIAPGANVGLYPCEIRKPDGSGYMSYNYCPIKGASSSTEKNIADIITSVKNYFNLPANASNVARIYETREVMRSDDYLNPDKQNYLNYLYNNLQNQGLSASTFSESISSTSLLANSIVTASLGTHNSPWCSNQKQSLYYGNAPSVGNYPGWAKLDAIFTQVKSGLTGSKLFPVNDMTTLTPGAVLGTASSLKAIKMASGAAWYRLFDAQNKRFNVYLMPSVNMVGPASDYKMQAGSQITPILGDDSIYRFKVTMEKQFLALGSTPHVVECYGYTDFGLGKTKTLQNVVLSDADYSQKCLDTLPCERITTIVAIQQGQSSYRNYMDSIKRYHYLAMKDFFPANTVDTLDFTTWKQQYQYTLYNYDLAGNLTSTIPPEGVHPMSSTIGIDAARNSNNQYFSYYPNNGKKSEYWYNTMNQLEKQITPDAGLTEFFYDKAGRLTFSQNAKQKPSDRYSYTLYDPQGRIKETGAVILDHIVWGSGTIHNVLVRLSNTKTGDEIATVITAKPREDVVATFYDEALLSLSTNPGMTAQENLRKRVSSVLYVPKLLINNSAESFYSYGTHFSYDALGNVKTLVQDNPYMDYMGQRFKRIDYDYDLLSGKVNMVSYNRGRADQFYQKYAYDADNRITKVETSNDGLIWDKDAGYEYYKHGPLAKMEIGDLKVQSIQYAYTIQGWLKAINGDVLDSTADMGLDGASGGLYPKDVFAHALEYHQGDYKPIGTTPVIYASTSTVNPLVKSLYNGNIARQTTAIHSLDNLQRTYTYDQLNRIWAADYNKIDNLTHAVVSMAQYAYANSYRYDMDGNIKELARRNETGALIDYFTYNYVDPAANNKLGSVSDAATISGGNDLQAGQVANNYKYDKIGNLVKDLQGNIDTMFWNLYGKVTDIKMNGTNKLIHYDYDAMGNRVRKDVSVLDPVSLSGNRESDLYVRDASGNILAVYKGKSKITSGLSISWINDSITRFHGSWNTSGFGLAPFLAQQLGTNGVFTSEIFTTAISQAPAWSNIQSGSLPLSQYLQLSNGIFSTAAHEPVSEYFEPFMAAGNAPQVAQSLAVGFDDLFMPVFRELIPPSIDEITLNKVRVQAIMSNMVNNAPNLSTELAGSLNLNSLYGGYGAGIFTQYVMDYGSRDFISIFSAQKKDSTELNNFISSIIADNSIINAGWFNLHNGASLLTADAVSKIADRTDASLFFQDWLIQKNKRWLEENSGLEERLNVVFQVDKPVFLTRYLDELGVGNVNRAIERIPQMTTAVYLDLVWEAVLHNTLNPTYRPPQVNTPDAGNIENDTIYLAEHHLYGSSRLGIKTYDKVQYRSVYQRPVGSTTPGTITENTLATQVPWYSGGFADWIQKDKTVLYTGSTYNLSLDSFYNVRTLGAKQYELTDHLGNVLVTVLDKKTGYGSVGGLYKGYWANLASVTDYYPFGMEMPGRSKSYSIYRNGFNGKENDNEVYGKGNYLNFGARGFDSRIGRWSSGDKLTAKYPSLSPYQFANNSPILLIDPDGNKIQINQTTTEVSFNSLALIINNYLGVEDVIRETSDHRIWVKVVNTDKMSAPQKAYYDFLFNMSNVPKVYKINVEEKGNKNDPFYADCYACGTIYVKNVESNNLTNYFTSPQVLYHFFREQKYKQDRPLGLDELGRSNDEIQINDGINYPIDHKKTVKDQMDIFGYQYTAGYTNEVNTDADLLDGSNKYITTVRSHSNGDGTYTLSNFIRKGVKAGDYVSPNWQDSDQSGSYHEKDVKANAYFEQNK